MGPASHQRRCQVASDGWRLAPTSAEIPGRLDGQAAGSSRDVSGADAIAGVEQFLA